VRGRLATSVPISYSRHGVDAADHVLYGPVRGTGLASATFIPALLQAARMAAGQRVIEVTTGPAAKWSRGMYRELGLGGSRSHRSEIRREDSGMTHPFEEVISSRERFTRSHRHAQPSGI
jgi:hypothetical protein